MPARSMDPHGEDRQCRTAVAAPIGPWRMRFLRGLNRSLRSLTKKPPRGQTRQVRCYLMRGRQKRATQQVREDRLPLELVVKTGHPRQDLPAKRRMSPSEPDQEGS
jgi:hypothetical protein